MSLLGEQRSTAPSSAPCRARFERCAGEQTLQVIRDAAQQEAGLLAAPSLLRAAGACTRPARRAHEQAGTTRDGADEASSTGRAAGNATVNLYSRSDPAISGQGTARSWRVGVVALQDGEARDGLGVGLADQHRRSRAAPWRKRPPRRRLTPFASIVVRKRRAASSVEKTPSEMALSGRIDMSVTPCLRSCAMRVSAARRSLRRRDEHPVARDLLDAPLDEAVAELAALRTPRAPSGCRRPRCRKTPTHAAPARLCTRLARFLGACARRSWAASPRRSSPRRGCARAW